MTEAKRPAAAGLRRKLRRSGAALDGTAQQRGQVILFVIIDGWELSRCD
jgi:hypothetical protein